MEQFKSMLEDFVGSINNDLVDRKINVTREVLFGLLIQYVENMIDNAHDQERYERGLLQKNWTGLNVENKELLVKRTYEIAALAYMLNREFKDE